MSNLTPPPPVFNARPDPFLRIKSDRVSSLLELVGELGLAANAVAQHPALAGLELEGYANATHRLDVLVRAVQEIAATLRLVPAGQVFRRMQRVVRDLAQETGKPVEVVLEGGEIEVDKAMLDQLNDSLVHLLRNAIDHGVEPPAERRAAGKPAQGRVTLAAAQRGSEIDISVADDGRGLDRAAILRQARTRGLAPTDAEPDDETVWGYIFLPGFSTAETVSTLSGRGVGLDVVQTAVQALRGRTRVTTQPGRGTRVTLTLPLTLAFLDSLIVRQADCLYALPLSAVSEVVQVTEGLVHRDSADASELVQVREAWVPLCRLETVYGGAAPAAPAVLVILHTSRGYLALPVEEVLGQEQVTLKPLQGQYVRRVRAGAAYALLSSGEVALTLDAERLWREWSRR